MNTKVLFISHDAQPHGAQILVLHLVRWIAANTGIRPHVLLKRDGPLRSEFAAVAPTTVMNPGDVDGLLRLCRSEQIDLIYSNTVVNGEVLEALAPLECPVITHVHELGYWISYRSGAVNNAQVVRHTNHFIAASNAVATCLQDILHVTPEMMSVVHEFVPTRLESFDAATARKRTREHFSIPPESFVVGGSGTTDWRKSPDLFIQMARDLKARPIGRPVHFLWVGGDNVGPEFGMLQHDVRRLGLEGIIHFTGHVEKPLELFAAFDVFALTSREDPYPLVVLEAAALGLPILAFEHSGGIPEFVEEDAGFVVPYIDTRAMAERASLLASDPALRSRLGSQGREKVRKRHDVGVSAPRIANVIEWLKLNHRMRPRRLPKAA